MVGGMLSFGDFRRLATWDGEDGGVRGRRRRGKEKTNNQAGQKRSASAVVELRKEEREKKGTSCGIS